MPRVNAPRARAKSLGEKPRAEAIHRTTNTAATTLSWPSSIPPANQPHADHNAPVSKGRSGPRSLAKARPCMIPKAAATASSGPIHPRRLTFGAPLNHTTRPAVSTSVASTEPSTRRSFKGKLSAIWDAMAIVCPSVKAVSALSQFLKSRGANGAIRAATKSRWSQAVTSRMW